ncbi:beta-1,6-N-acetylglucosaminyltransferase [Capnocytophaga leadbetteri]|uniref:beta-1,6-N-acetylglucosaminyltransferase n=1 Tax=Capnocytophaga leadbetteri TaxID=327575 RepID=UPI0026EE0AD0|nr:beta-1,6-N-acetylglucosaminyltransferase [Capnocytophaga leadbetteri]
MQKNYLILAHKNPLQLGRMIERLDDGASKFFIHLDAKTPIEPFTACLEGAHIRFIDKRERCVWGDFSIVQATIRLMEAASKEQGFFILMSGQDYPIQSQEYINDFLERNKEFDFIEIEPLEEKWKPKMVKDKLEHYHILHSEERGHSNCYAPFAHCSVFQKLRTLMHLLKGRLSMKNFKLLCSLPKRIAPFERQYAGSQFWAFSERTFYAVLNYIREHKAALEGYYKYTSSPDEIYFHSVLMDLVAKDSTIKLKEQITYVNYFRKNNVFVSEDFDKLTSAKGKFFARKFDTDIDIEILNKLDSYQENES